MGQGCALHAERNVERHMSRRLLAVLAGSALVAVVLVWPLGTAAHPLAKAFPIGCWKGKGQGLVIGEQQPPAPGLSINIDKSQYTFTLLVTRKTAVGGLDLNAHASGEMKANGLHGTVELAITGDLDITGNAAHLVVNGPLHYKGAVVANGISAPINATHESSPGQLEINTVKPKKVTGVAGTSTWTAVWTSKPKLGC
jgi:hypothetical protein